MSSLSTAAQVLHADAVRRNSAWHGGSAMAIAAHLALHAAKELHGIVALVVAMPCLVGGDHDRLDADGRERAVQCCSEGGCQFSAHRRHPLRGCC